jgi:hypothetical protein
MSQCSLKSYLIQLMIEQLWLLTRTLEGGGGIIDIINFLTLHIGKGIAYNKGFFFWNFYPSQANYSWSVKVLQWNEHLYFKVLLITI